MVPLPGDSGEQAGAWASLVYVKLPRIQPGCAFWGNLLTVRLCHSADGYDYVCNGTVATCCSQDVDPAAGTALGHAQIGFGSAMSLLRGNATAGRQWNNHSRSPFFEYTSAADGKRHQVWYDDVESLRLKYDLVTKLGLRGVGFWPADIGSLAGPGGTGVGTWNVSDVKAMWAAVP